MHWFRRGRICRTCKKTFMTAEIEESYLEELSALRHELEKLNKQKAQCVEISKSLKEFSDNLINTLAR